MTYNKWLLQYLGIIAASSFVLGLLAVGFTECVWFFGINPLLLAVLFAIVMGLFVEQPYRTGKWVLLLAWIVLAILGALSAIWLFGLFPDGWVKWIVLCS